MSDVKFDPPINSNYAAVVVEIKAVNDLEGMDNVAGTPLLGLQAIVGKDMQVGTIGIAFPAETQLSYEYAYENNLHRHGNLNKDEGAAGYLEDNRRVRAVRFRGHPSNSLFMPLESLAFTGYDISKLKVGDVFDKLNGVEICRKYVVREPVSRVEKNKQKAKERRVDEKFLPAHFDTSNYWRNADTIPPTTEVIVTAKLHGTSVRLANTLVKRRLDWKEKVAKWFGVQVKEYEYDYVAGSRRVIKDPNDPDQQNFYTTDVWTEALKRVEGIIPEGFVIYGELVGWTSDGAEIQKNYTYGLPKGTNELYVYRVAQVNPQGRLTDLSWNQVKEFCKDLGLKHVPELVRMRADHFKAYVEDYVDVRFADMGFDSPSLDKPKLVDEGVCIRVDGLVPYILKAKSPKFLEHETKLLDKGEEDMESMDG